MCRTITQFKEIRLNEYQNFFSLGSVAIAISLVGCGGGSSSSADETAMTPMDPTAPNTPTAPTTPTTVSGNVSQLGFIGFEQFESFDGASEESEIFAAFFNATDAFDATLAQGAIFPANDTCIIEDDEDFNDLDTAPDIDGVDFDNITLSAGDVITVSSPTGTFASLQLISAFGFSGYQTDAEITGPLPTGLTVDIPGDQFPAFANVSIPNAALVTGATPDSDQPIAANTTFSWNAGNNPDARVTISADDVFCTVVDDGSFTLPANIQAQLGSDFGVFGYDITRFAVNFVQSGNAVLVVTSEGEEG